MNDLVLSRPQKILNTDKMHKLHFKKDGSGEKVVLLLPGLLGSTRYYNELTKRLITKNFTVYRLDLLGFGLSDKPHEAKEYSIKNQAEGILLVLKANNIDKIDLLLGYSVSTVLATHLYADNKSLFKNLLLISPIIYESKSVAIEKIIDSNNIPKWLLRGPMAEKVCKAMCVVPGLCGAVASITTRDTPLIVRWDTRHHHWDSYSSSLEAAISDTTALTVLRTSKRGVSILYGDKDISTDSDLMKQVAEQNKNITLHTWQGRHHPAIKQPQMVADLVDSIVR